MHLGASSVLAFLAIANIHPVGFAGPDHPQSAALALRTIAASHVQPGFSRRTASLAVTEPW